MAPPNSFKKATMAQRDHPIILQYTFVGAFFSSIPLPPSLPLPVLCLLYDIPCAARCACRAWLVWLITISFF
jgi:hypothetical protein